MSKADKNDLIYFKQCCDKTYATSKNANGSGLVQQTVNGSNVFPKTKAKAVIMSDGSTLESAMQAVSVNEVVISGNPTLMGIGIYKFGISLYPNNYSVNVKTIEVTSSHSGLVISNITKVGFVVNVNSIPASASQTLTVKVTDVNNKVITGTLAISVNNEPTSLKISGSTEIDNETANNYTISYSPSDYNITPSSIEVSANPSSFVVSNKTNTGFTLTPNCSESVTANITVTATMPSGNVITNTISIDVSCGPDYDKIDDCGVAIMDINGKFYEDAAEWRSAGSPAVNGIAVSDGTHRFCIAKDMITKKCYTGSSVQDVEYWGAYGTLISGVTTVSSSSGSETVKTDFAGVANTNAIVSAITASDGYFTKSPYSAAGLCREYVFPNGAKGYLGAGGEWNMVNNSINTINTLINEIGGSPLANSNVYIYWTSTQQTKSQSWRFGLIKSSGCNTVYRYETARVRAFCSF